MIFAKVHRKIGEKERERLRGRQYVQLADMNRQRLHGYAESFRELAESFRDEYRQENSADRMQVLEERKRWENRQLISNNLTEVASIMEQVAVKELCYEPLEEKKSRMLIHALRSEGIYVETPCYLPVKDGCRSIGMVLYTEKKDGVGSEEVAQMLSLLLQTGLEVSAASPYTVDRQRRTFLFVEQACYMALSGMAKVVKDTETVSGDNYAILHSDNGKKVVLLSDGTGSGRKACEDSGRILDLMEKMLEAGFALEAAVTMVNTAMFARGEESNHPTLDICNLDLYSGECDFCKVGGAVSYIKRGKEVDIISQGSLPLGIFQNITVQTQHYLLQDGDYLFFLTDGVLDALNHPGCEDILEEIIADMPERGPQEMAEKLLQHVLKCCGGHIVDDMTVLVIGIWENT